jgi:hypothetical protein
VYLVFVKHDELTIETAVLRVRVAMDVPTLTAAFLPGFVDVIDCCIVGIGVTVDL